jgi:hypothetical protein
MKKLLVFFAFVLLLSSCGKDGVNGKDGISGLNGQDGSDATVEMIKLCPSIEEQYPSQFPEYAVCV